MLDEALDFIPKARLVKLAARYVDLKRLEPDGASRRGLFAAVEKFERASLAGEFYESFNVNSKNFMQKSNGTRAWIAECQRLLRQLVIAEGKEDPADVATALESIFRLLHHIDEGHDDVIFFADEGGSWQVGVEWRQVFPGWVRCLARIASPQEYSERVVEMIDDLDRADRAIHLREARKAATTAQKKALAQAVSKARGSGS